MVQSLTQPADFRRLLQRRPLARHAGWSLHACRPEFMAGPELSTGASPTAIPLVDESTPDPAGDPLPGADAPVGPRHSPTLWTGVVLSRRNVRRATSRNLMRRLWRAMLAELPAAEPLDGWQVLLRRTAPWSRETFRSTQSTPMRRQLRADLSVLIAALAAAPGRPASGVSDARVTARSTAALAAVPRT